MEGHVSPVSGLLTGYFKVPVTGQYGFLLQGTFVGARLKINDVLVLDAYMKQSTLRSTGYTFLDSQRINTFAVEFFSYATSSSSRTMAIFWSTPTSPAFVPFDQLYYSQNACFDGIEDPDEGNTMSDSYCPADTVAPLLSTNQAAFCGDNICQERDPNWCIQDCASSVTPVCSPLAAPNAHIPSGFQTGSDTLGTLIDNQMFFHLPGIEHLTFGIDVVTGEEKLAPLFYFGYCNNASTNIVQDLYRSSVYTIPEEVHAEPFPRCSYKSDSTEYSSSIEMQRSMSTASKIAVSGSVSVDGWLVQAEADAAFSLSRQVQTANDLEMRRSGSLLVTEVMCSSSKVTLNEDEVSFHPIFIADISKADTAEKMKAAIYKFGTHYYKSATLGGKLSQITAVDASFDSTSTSQQLTEAADLSFSASVSSSLYGSVSGSFGATADSSVSDDFMISYSSKSSRSTLMTMGGKPGAYGPLSDKASFGDWAVDVDLLPVPIESTLARIRDLIPSAWLVGANASFAGKKVVDLWVEAERLYFTEVSDNYYAATKTLSRYTLYWNFSRNYFPISTSFINIKIADGNPILVEDQAGQVGTRGPLRYDTRAGICDSPTAVCDDRKAYRSPVVFEFTAPDTPVDLPVQLYYKDSNPSDNLLHSQFNTQSYFLIDDDKSQFFAFYPLQAPVTIPPPPLYDHSVILLHLGVFLRSPDSGVYRQSNNAIMGYMNVQITLRGRNGQIDYHAETKPEENWPTLSYTANPWLSMGHVLLSIPKKNEKIGPITSIHLRGGIPRLVRVNVPANPTTRFSLQDIWAVQTFCADTTAGLSEDCENDRQSGVSYVYAAPEGAVNSLSLNDTGITLPLFSLRNRNAHLP